jgi:hypothetical protein
LRAVVERDLADAAIPELSTDRRFATAYNAVLQMAKMAVACAGYRTLARPRQHETSFQAAELALGKSAANHIAFFDTCRVKRNRVDYDLAGVISETEAAELLEKAAEFRDLLEQWIKGKFPQLA